LVFHRRRFRDVREWMVQRSDERVSVRTKSFKKAICFAIILVGTFVAGIGAILSGPEFSKLYQKKSERYGPFPGPFHLKLFLIELLIFLLGCAIVRYVGCCLVRLEKRRDGE